MLCFVINLDDSVDRLKLISNQLDRLNVSFSRLSAVNGRELQQNEIRKLSYAIDDRDIRVRYTRDLTPGEIGCFLSHRKCWKMLLESSHNWALILEDDIVISPLAANYMRSDSWLPSDVKICQLSCLKKTQCGRIAQKKAISNDIRLVNPIFPSPLGTQAYFISREFAEKAISLSEKFPAPVDDFLFSPWFDLSWRFKIWRTDPVLVIPSSDFNSDVGGRDKKNVTKAPFFLRHGLKRFLLNYKIHKYQKQGEEFEFKFYG